MEWIDLDLDRSFWMMFWIDRNPYPLSPLRIQTSLIIIGWKTQAASKKQKESKEKKKRISNLSER